MRNDYDADDDRPERQAEGLRWMTVAVVMLVVAGFFALAFYAYRNGGTAPSETLETIHAEAGPVKDKPKDPGGMSIPYQDMSVYNVISGEKKDDQQVEQLLPDPEEPMAKTAPTAAPAAATETFIKTEPPVTPTPATPAAPETKAPETAAAPAPQVQTGSTSDQPNRFMEKAASEIKPVGELTPAAPAASAPKPVEAKGNIQVQLAALKSAPEAEKTWSQIKSRFPAPLDGKSHSIVKAELPSGTFYRLRVGGFSTDAARKLCADLATRKQPCMIVR